MSNEHPPQLPPSRQEMIDQIFAHLMASDLEWTELTSSPEADPDPLSVRTIGTIFFSSSGPRSIVLSLGKDGAVAGLTEKADRSGYAGMPGSPEQLRAFWDRAVGHLVE